MRKQWKLAAIMVIDIVGYTALKPIIRKFNGEWLKEIEQRTLWSFPNVVDAVMCALKIQRSAEDDPELSFRIGIHIGDIVFENDDIIGEAVQVASQLLNFAEPGGICVSERVYYGVQKKPDIVTEFQGEKSLKNIERRIKVYAVKEKVTPLEETERGSGKKSQPSIAVLPFTDLSPAKDQDYFCDGIAEEIIHALSHVEGLRVVARTSAFSFRGREIDVREIGRKLNVETLLEGSVRKADNRVRITAQLINIADGYHLWSGAFNRELEDIFAIQEEISLAIVNELKVKLLKKEKATIVKHYTDNIEAYEQYLLGRYYWNRRNEEALRKGLGYFHHAIEKDPNYAQAYTGIADSYNILGFWSYMSPKDSFTKAKEAAGKALKLDNTLAEAHTSLAFVSFCFDWNWLVAENGFKRAIKLNPGYATAHYWYAVYLNIQGRFNEAFREIKKAYELDPLALIIHFLTIDCYYLMGRYDEAIEQFHKAIDIDPNFGLVYFRIGSVYRQQGKYEEAIAALKKSLKLTEGLSWVEGELGYTYGLSGKRDNAEQILLKMIEQKKEKYVPSSFISHVYSGLGENDAALEWLEKAFEERETMIPLLKIYPDYESLRTTPGFNELLKKIGLPE